MKRASLSADTSEVRALERDAMDRRLCECFNTLGAKAGFQRAEWRLAIQKFFGCAQPPRDCVVARENHAHQLPHANDSEETF